MTTPSTRAPILGGRRAWIGLGFVAVLLAAPPLLRRLRGPTPVGVDLELHAQPRPLAELSFSDGQGKPSSLAAFRGRVVLLNVWATWCLPCREEMPTLDRLQAALGGPGFEVVTLSIDQGGLPPVQSFFRQIGIKHLQPYLDSLGEVSSGLVATGIPLTLLIDGEGREIGRKLGPAAWDAPKMVAFLRRQIAPDRAPSPPAPG